MSPHDAEQDKADEEFVAAVKGATPTNKSPAFQWAFDQEAARVAHLSNQKHALKGLMSALTSYVQFARSNPELEANAHFQRITRAFTVFKTYYDKEINVAFDNPTSGPGSRTPRTR